MLDAPVVDRITQLVVDLASRRLVELGPSEEERHVSDDETEKKDVSIIPETPSSSSDESPLEQRKPKRARRLNQRERRRWRLCGATGSLSVRNQDAKQILHVPRSTVDPGFGGKDPFGAFELPKDPLTDLALHHWVDIFQNSRMAISPRKAWLKINLSDKTLLSVTTFCSASHFYFIRGVRAPPSCLPVKVNAIQNINKTLQKPGTIPSDYTMVAVAVMTLIECLSGDPKACAIHRKGLQLMVQARGGLQNLGFDGAVKRTVSWADTCCAILRRVKPSLTPVLTPDIGETEIPSLTDAGYIIADLENRLLPLTKSADLNQHIIYVWLRLRYLTEFLVCFPNETIVLDECYFTDKIDFIERYIIGLLHSDDLTKNPAVAFLTTFLNASLIFIYEELRECPKWTNICMALSGRIHSGLHMADISSVAKHCPDLLLWILLLGRSGNPPMGEMGERGRAWYRKEISEIEDMMGIEVSTKAAGYQYFALADASSPPGNRGLVSVGIKQRQLTPPME